MMSKRKILVTAMALCASTTGYGGAGVAPSAAAQALAPTASAVSPVDDACARLTGTRLDQVIIDSARTQPAGAPVAGAHLPGLTGQPGGGPAIAGLPAFCRVAGHIRPETGSDIGFEVWLPSQGWDGRMTGAGNGGLAGSISYNDLASAVRAGQVGASTDTGHVGDGYQSGWAKGHPEKVRDYGWRAIHLTTVAGKALAAAFYGRSPDRAYFVGCSNGGRAGLMEAALFPDDYDGVVAGAPAAVITDIAMSMIWATQAQQAPGAAIRPDQIKLLQRTVLAQCDQHDGQADGLVADPRRCRLDVKPLACGVDTSPQCFTPPQLAALAKIHQGPRDAAGRSLAPGFPATGAELGWPAAFFGWDGTLTVGAKPTSSGDLLAAGMLRDLPSSPIGDVASFDFKGQRKQVKAELAKDLDAKPDLSRFLARGGKLILWHGWADATIPPQATIDFHQAMLKASGPRAQAQSRLFMVPGVQHCFGGPGPAIFGQFGAPAPVETPERNIAAAMQAWVEAGRAPQSLVGRRGLMGMPGAPSAGPETQRLICAYPAQAVLAPGADPDKAGSYACKTAKSGNGAG